MGRGKHDVAIGGQQNDVHGLRHTTGEQFVSFEDAQHKGLRI